MPGSRTLQVWPLPVSCSLERAIPRGHLSSASLGSLLPEHRQEPHAHEQVSVRERTADRPVCAPPRVGLRRRKDSRPGSRAHDRGRRLRWLTQTSCSQAWPNLSQGSYVSVFWSSVPSTTLLPAAQRPSLPLPSSPIHILPNFSLPRLSSSPTSGIKSPVSLLLE